MKRIEYQTISIIRRIHRPTGLIAAYSDDLKGLMVFGDTDAEVERKLPGAIREMMEAMGREVLSVEPREDAGWSDVSNKSMQVRLAEAA